MQRPQRSTAGPQAPRARSSPTGSGLLPTNTTISLLPSGSLLPLAAGMGGRCAPGTARNHLRLFPVGLSFSSVSLSKAQLEQHRLLQGLGFCAETRSYNPAAGASAAAGGRSQEPCPAQHSSSTLQLQRAALTNKMKATRLGKVVAILMLCLVLLSYPAGNFPGRTTAVTEAISLTKA